METSYRLANLIARYGLWRVYAVLNAIHAAQWQAKADQARGRGRFNVEAQCRGYARECREDAVQYRHNWFRFRGGFYE